MSLVDKIIAAKKQYDETDRPWLSKLADGQLGKIAASCGCEADPKGAATPTADAPPASATATAAATDPTPTPSAAAPAPAAAATPATVAATAVTTAPAAEPPLTAEQWIEKTPENLRGVFGGLLAQRRSDEAALRQQIVTQSGGEITTEYLASKELEELQILARATRKQDFSGRGVPAGDPVAQASAKQGGAPRMPGIKIGTGAAA